jgi:hypothetical protein
MVLKFYGPNVKGALTSAGAALGELSADARQPDLVVDQLNLPDMGAAADGDRPRRPAVTQPSLTLRMWLALLSRPSERCGGAEAKAALHAACGFNASRSTHHENVSFIRDLYQVCIFEKFSALGPFASVAPVAPLT